jgi:hypothetical protein
MMIWGESDIGTRGRCRSPAIGFAALRLRAAKVAGKRAVANTIARFADRLKTKGVVIAIDC